MQQQRVEFWQLVRGIVAKDLIFLDESGVNLAMVRLLARSAKGQRAHGKRLQKRGKNVSMLGAIGLSGVITQVPMLGAVDGLLFEAFIAQKLVPKLWKGACVILAKSHKVRQVILTELRRVILKNLGTPFSTKFGR